MPTISVDDAFARFESGIARAFHAVRSQSAPETIAAAFADGAAACRAIESIAPEITADEKILAIERCARAIEGLDNRAREIFNDQRVADAVVARAIGVLRGEARLVRRVVRAIEGMPALDESAFRLAELQDAENALRSRLGALSKGTLAAFDPPPPRSAPPPPAAPTAPFIPQRGGAGGAGPHAAIDDAECARLCESLRDGRIDLLLEQAARRLDAARALTSIDVETAPRAFDLYRSIDAMHRDLDARRAELPEPGNPKLTAVVEALESDRARLEREFFRFAENVDSPAGLEILRRASRALERELDEGRVIGLEPATEARIARLRHLQLVGERFQRTCRATMKRHNAPESVEMKKLDAMLKRVRHVVGDRVLELRLHRIFGARLVKAWESLVFWLILSVLLLLAIDHWRGPDEPGVIHWTIWVDTGICAVLLLDFTTRTLLSPNPLRYFQRHLLTELLPALPFGLLANLEQLTAIQSIRTIRLVRTLTFLQALRPLIRIGRLFLFVSRAADRVVEQNAWLLNQNIVFFTEGSADDVVPTLVKRARELEAFILRQSIAAAAHLPPTDISVAAEVRLAIVRVERVADFAEDGVANAAAHASIAPLDLEPRYLDVDDVIQRMRDLDSSQVAEFVGADIAQQITDSLRFFRLPWLRRMPVVRFVMGDTGVPDPLATTARLGRVCGDLLDFTQRAVNWFADLYGTITPSQFLDRVGSQIVNATARPARRLIMFGVIVLMIMALVELTHFAFLDATAHFFIKFLSGPLIGLGLLCALPLALGTWFRHIARQAADFYDRIAEAQFLSLTEILKEETREDDLRYLGARVVLPESRLAGDDEATVTTRLAEFANRGIRITEGRGAPVSFESSLYDDALLYYRDFLDGAYFHRNDTKVANLLLGNLTLENVRQHRLRFTKRDWKRLERIDIGRGKGGIGGAAVWFNCITHSVAQNVARLILEYNRVCIPVSEVRTAKARDKDRFDHWMESRERQSLALARGEAVLPTDIQEDIAELALTYRTTEFHALHFLSANPRRDEAVRRRFGARVLRYLRGDRENLIRVIFGTFPMRDLPRDRRTINPYELYRRHFANGMFYLAPPRALWLLLRGIGRLVKEIVRIVREVRRPETRTTPRQSGHASFEVARRKIHRMRRPIVMEALRLRAEFDPEYLGLALVDRPSHVPPDQQFSEDLRALNASEREWEQFRRLKSTRQEELRRLAHVLRILEHRGRVLRSPDGDSLTGDASRAVAIAWISDHEHASSRVRAFESMLDLLYRVARAPAVKRRFRMPRIGRPRVRELVDAAWPELTRHAPPSNGVNGANGATDSELRERFVEAILGPEVHLRDHLETLASPRALRTDGSSDGDVYDCAWHAVSSAASQPSDFTAQVIAVRAVHALAMLDLLGYERQVEGLGGYGMTNEDP